MSRFRNDTEEHDEIKVVPDDSELVSRLHMLRDEVHQILGDQFDSALEELQQLRDLLNDAARKLADGFREVDRNSRRQEKLAREIVAEGRADALDEIGRIADAISEGAGIAIQGLQFEDMSNQLLQHLDRRLILLEEFSVDMSLLRAQGKDGNGVGQEGLTKLEKVLNSHKDQLREWDNRAVRQSNLDTGSVDLF